MVRICEGVRETNEKYMSCFNSTAVRNYDLAKDAKVEFKHLNTTLLPKVPDAR